MPPPIDLKSITDPAVNNYMTLTGTPGMSAAVSVNNQNTNTQDIETFGYGYIDTAKSASVTAETIFCLGSVTKLFTAIILQSLVNQGQADLGSRVTDLLPMVPHESQLASVTLQDLATHTAGMPNNIPGENAIELFGDKAPAQDLVRWWGRFKPEPSIGTCYRYSNIGFVTLGFAVSGMVSGVSQYSQQLTDLITTPLEMANTGAFPQGASVALGYTGTATTNNPSNLPGHDLKSNASDMSKLLVASIVPSGSGGVGTAISGTQESYFTGNNCDGSKAPLTFQQGLAWEIRQVTINNQPYTLLTKNGIATTAGFMAWIGVVPNIAGVVLLMNKVMTGTPPITMAACGQIIIKGILTALNNQSE